MDPLRHVVDLLAPPRCGGCGARGDVPWCARCRSQVRAIGPDACRRCGDTGGPHGCWPDDGPVAATVCALRYHGPVRAAIVDGKVRGARSLWPALGALLADAAVARLPADVRAVTWVPVDRRRWRERGFDQAELLAAPVADRLGVPLVRLLAARPGRPDQASRAPAERGRLPVGAFRPLRPLPPATLVLVDDVLTTGATVRAAASALRGAGAREVHVAVLARAGHHPLGGHDPAVPDGGVGGGPGRAPPERARSDRAPPTVTGP